jgi:hypothetical protein
VFQALYFVRIVADTYKISHNRKTILHRNVEVIYFLFSCVFFRVRLIFNLYINNRTDPNTTRCSPRPYPCC